MKSSLLSLLSSKERALRRWLENWWRITSIVLLRLMEKRLLNWKIKSRMRSSLAGERSNRSRSNQSPKRVRKSTRSNRPRLKPKQRSHMWRTPMRKQRIGIDWAHTKPIFKNRKKRSKIRRSKSNKKLTKSYWINSFKKRSKFRHMRLTLKKLMSK